MGVGCGVLTAFGTAFGTDFFTFTGVLDFGGVLAFGGFLLFIVRFLFHHVPKPFACVGSVQEVAKNKSHGFAIAQRFISHAVFPFALLVLVLIAFVGRLERAFAGRLYSLTFWT